MKKLLFAALLFVGQAALCAEPAAPLTAESQRAYFKVYDRVTQAMIQQRRDLLPELMKEMSRLGDAGDPRAAFQYALYHITMADREKGIAMAEKLFPELLKLAQKDDWLACQNVAACYAHGVGCTRDNAAANRWNEKSWELMKKAAADDDPVAMFERATRLLMMGEDPEEPERLLMRLKKHDSKSAEYALKIIAKEKKDAGK